jgi:hypothetical protein
MVATTPAGALVGTAANRVALLGGGDPFAPIAAPLAWATLAVSRRDISDAAVSVAPAAVVTTGAPAAGSALLNLVGQPNVTSALVGAAKRFVLAVVSGEDIPAALGRELQMLNANPLFHDLTLDSILNDPGLPQAAGQALNSVVAGLTADAEVRAAIGSWISDSVVSFFGNNPAAAGVAATASAGVTGLLANPATSSALGATASTFASVLLAQPGVLAAANDIADQLREAVAGSGAVAALNAAWDSLQADPAIQNGLGVAVSAALNTLLSNSGLVHALGATVTNTIVGLANDPSLQSLAGQVVSENLAALLADNPAAAGIVSGLDDVVAALTANSAVSGALAGAVGDVLTHFLSAPGIPGALADIGGQVAIALLAGNDPSAALDVVWQSLQANSAFSAAVAGTVANALNGLLTDSDLISTLGAAATALVATLTADPTAWGAIGELAGSTFGEAILSMLADPAAAGRLAALAGTAITGFLGTPGVAAGVSDTVELVIGAVLTGASVDDAVHNALLSLQADPAIQDALESLFSGVLQSILGDPAVQQVVSSVAEDAIDNLVAGSGDAPGLPPVAGTMLKSAVNSLLANTAVQTFISDLGTAAVGGGDMSNVPATVVHTFLNEPKLQSAIGDAIGDGIGALFGENLVGVIVSKVVAVTATFWITVASRIVVLFGGFGLPGAAAASDSDAWWLGQAVAAH